MHTFWNIVMKVYVRYSLHFIIGGIEAQKNYTICSVVVLGFESIIWVTMTLQPYSVFSSELCYNFPSLFALQTLLVPVTLVSHKAKKGCSFIFSLCFG